MQFTKPAIHIFTAIHNPLNSSNIKQFFMSLKCNFNKQLFHSTINFFCLESSRKRYNGISKSYLPIPIDRFTEKLVEEAGILIMPGSVFDFPGNFFRIGFGRKNMPEVLKRFEQYLKSHANIH